MPFHNFGKPVPFFLKKRNKDMVLDFRVFVAFFNKKANGNGASKDSDLSDPDMFSISDSDQEQVRTCLIFLILISFAPHNFISPV